MVEHSKIIMINIICFYESNAIATLTLHLSSGHEHDPLMCTPYCQLTLVPTILVYFTLPGSTSWREKLKERKEVNTKL